MNTRVYVSNLPETTTEANLHAAFGAFGAISKIFVATDRVTAQPTYAFVTYATTDEVGAAVAGMNDAAFEGRALAVSVAREEKVLPPVRRFVPPASTGPRRGPGGPPRGGPRR